MYRKGPIDEEHHFQAFGVNQQIEISSLYLESAHLEDQAYQVRLMNTRYDLYNKLKHIAHLWCLRLAIH